MYREEDVRLKSLKSSSHESEHAPDFNIHLGPRAERVLNYDIEVLYHHDLG